MKNQPTTFKSCALPRFFRGKILAGLLPVLILLVNIQFGHASSATALHHHAFDGPGVVDSSGPQTARS